MPEDSPEHDSDAETALRQLALVDRIIGLEAELAHLRSVDRGGRADDQVRQIHASTTWRVGRAVLAPASFLKRLIGRFGTR